MKLKLLLFILLLTLNQIGFSIQFESFFLDILNAVINQNVLDNKLNAECAEKLIRFNQSVHAKDEWALRGKLRLI
jgi:hypothetical protein